MALTKRQMGAILILAGLFSRLLFLSHPNEVVFDEVHWGKFINAYCATHENFFDVHPPHGKLLVATLVKAFGYGGGQSFDLIGTPYQQASATALRILSALMGSLIPFVTFLLLLELGTSATLSFFGGFLLLFDNALLLQSRIMGLYPMLLLSLLCSLFFFLRAHQSSQTKKILWLSLSGIACGFSVGFQFTGILALAVVALFQLHLLLHRKTNFVSALHNGITITAIAGLVYLLGWKYHFSLLPLSGSGDLFYKNTGDFWRDLIELHKVMYRASATLTTSHPEASTWWTWPLMLTPIYYWKGKEASLYFVGNPVFWWSVSTLFVYASASKLFKAKRSKRKDSYLLPLFLSFLFSFIPLTLMKRVLFLYHYLTPLTYEWLFVVLWLSEKHFLGNLQTPRQQKQFAVAVGILLIGFFSVLPLTIGFSPPSWYWQVIPWRFWH